MKNIKYKVIFLIVFTLIQLLILNTIISFATDDKTVQKKTETVNETKSNKEEILDGTYVIRSVLNNKLVLDVSQASTSNFANIQLYEYVGVDQQKFKVKKTNDGYYTITALHSEKMLDVANAEKTPGTNVWQCVSNNTDAQKWTIKATDDGSYNIISKCNGLYLNIADKNPKNESNIEVNTGNNSKNQKFKFEKVINTTIEGQKTVEDGVYVIRTALDEKFGLDVSQASIANSANIQIYENIKVNQQKFYVKYMGNGYYTIKAQHSDKVLDVSGAGKTPGTNVQQYESNDTDAQKWVIAKTKDGYYNIISKCNGLYLNIANNKAKNEANVEVNTKNESVSQKFKFEKIQIPEKKQTIADGTYVIKTALNEKYGLDVSEASKADRANIQIYEYVKANQQKFKVKYLGNGYYTLTALHSGKVLDVSAGGKLEGTNVQQFESNNTDAQKWIIAKTDDGYYNIISKCNLLYLNVSGNVAKNEANIQLNSENRLNSQKFKFEKASEVEGQTLIGEKTISDGVYSISTALNEKYGLDVSQASKSNGGNIQLYEYVNVNQQKFYVKYLGNGCYTLKILHSGKVLDVAEGSKKPGANVQQYESNNTDAQKWIIAKTEDGYYNIISKNSELYLDVTNSIVKNETNIRVYTGNNTKAQKFKFTKAKISCEEGTYGKSGLAVKGDPRGTNLKYYKFGQGPNVLFATFSIHGFEDAYSHDGKELTYIAEQFRKYLAEKSDISLYNNWTIYIFPTVNPDGQIHGTTNNGPGRTTLYSAAPNNKGIDMNRNFQTSDYVTYKDDRNYNGTAAFQAYEARYLRDFLLNNKSQNGQTILIDLHGWLNESMGDNELGAFYRNQYGMTKHISSYGRGYLINWARMSLGNSNKSARTALIELPQVNSHEELVNKDYATKYINATINMLKSIK